MSYIYHIYVAYIYKGKSLSQIYFDFDEASIKETFADPYMKGRPILIRGRFVQISDIDEISIYKSKKPYAELILPNGKSPIEEENNEYINYCFGLKKVKGKIGFCTDEFITSPPEPKRISIKTLGKKENVFIVHGRDEKQALRLQKYLTKTLKIHAEMFEDLKEASGSNTIIEQLEYIKDNVGYAFVIVTPDDLGCLREDIDKCRTTMLVGKRSITVKSVCDILDNLNTRARQNVVFEHGLFIGALGRDKVCCLLQEDTTEKPSDIDGILYVSFKKSVKETFPEITEKLKKAGLIKT